MTDYWKDSGLVKPLAERRRSRFWLFAPFLLLVAVVAAYSAYWTYARAEIEQGVDEWVAAERARGAIVEYESRDFGGYPFRFELELTSPRYQPPNAASWEGEQLQLVMQPWNWNHVIARAPGRSVLTDRMGIRHIADLDGKSAASLSWDTDGVHRAALELNDVSALIEGQAYTAQGFSLNLAPSPDLRDNLRVALQWDMLTLETVPASAPWLGTEIQESRLIGEVGNFYPAWMRSGGQPEHLYSALQQEGGGVEVGQVLLNWGPLKFGAKGRVTMENGLANGSFGVRIDDPKGLKDALKAAGYWRVQEQAAVATLETASANGGFLTFTLDDNKLKIGTVVLGELPGPGL
jgi:hypothetical protein